MSSCSVFQCLNLPDDYKRGKLLAYQLLCQTMVRRHNVPLSTELLSQFYMCLHTGIGTRDQVSYFYNCVRLLDTMSIYLLNSCLSSTCVYTQG